MKSMALVVGLILAMSVYGAALVPFNASIDTVVTQTGTCGMTCASLSITGVGTGTLLCRVEIEGPSQINFATLLQSGTSTLTAADGSSFDISFAGGFIPGATPGDVTFSGTWTVVSGTKRFRNTTGNGTYEGSAVVPAGVLHLSGTLSVGK